MGKLAFVVSLGLVGCGSAELVLKAPVVDQCNSAKLKGCDEMADGVIAYVDGKKDDGRKLLMRAAGKNAPKEVEVFSKSLRSASKMPGLESYAETLAEIAAALETMPANNDAPKKVDAPDARSATRVLAGTANVGDAPSCSTVLGPSVCTRVLTGPASIETLIARCSVTLAIIAGEPSEPHWQIVVPPGTLFQTSQLQLPVADAERLTIAASNASSDCAVTWVVKKGP